MTKEEAREKLHDLLLSQAYINCGKIEISLPITDINTNTVSHDNGINVVFKQYSFRYLLKIAYDLEDKK
jgi:hypothetical protein